MREPTPNWIIFARPLSIRSRQRECMTECVWSNRLHRYWVARVYWREANGWLKRLLAVSGTEDGTPLRARTLFVIGHITNYYDPTQARSFAEESLRLARSLDYKEGIIDALWLMGWLNYPKLDGTAAPYFEESIELARAIDHVYGAVHAYAWYGVYKIGVGDYEGAKLALREGMVQAERVGDYIAKKLALREGTSQAERIGGDATLLGRCAGNLGFGGDVARRLCCSQVLPRPKSGAGERRRTTATALQKLSGSKAGSPCVRTILIRRFTISKRALHCIGHIQPRCGLRGTSSILRFCMLRETNSRSLRSWSAHSTRATKHLVRSMHTLIHALRSLNTKAQSRTSALECQQRFSTPSGKRDTD